MKLTFKRLRAHAVIPVRATAGSAGLDLRGQGLRAFGGVLASDDAGAAGDGARDVIPPIGEA